MTAASSLPYGVPPDGFRLPDLTRVGRVRLQISDLARSVAFYQGVIGLDLIDRRTHGVLLGAPGDGDVIVELHERPRARPVSRRGTLGLFHFAILLPDRAALGRFLRHALARGVVTGLADHAVSEAVYLSDPDGLGIEVYADRPRHTWQARPNRELHLTTEPLDVDGVLSLSADGAWDHVPAGTTMGHVHLHVGDLEQSAAYYHRAMGFDKIVWTYPGALFLSAGGYHHHLGTNTWSSGVAPLEDQARLLSWELQTTEPDAVARHLVAQGFAARKDDDRWRSADPWGTEIEITTLRNMDKDA